MNKTKIEWTDYSWNPITGCKHGCWYCYAGKMFHRFGRSFEPTFYPERLDELDKIKKPCKIFVCSVADLFAPWTKPEWKNAVMNKIYGPLYDHITFQLLTKNPENIHLPPKDNIWIGTTITKMDEMKNAYELIKNYKGIKFLSFEPILGEIDLLDIDIDWIIVGKLTGSRKIKLRPFWVRLLLSRAIKYDIPIFIKDNIKWQTKIQEFPK